LKKTAYTCLIALYSLIVEGVMVAGGLCFHRHFE